VRVWSPGVKVPEVHGSSEQSSKGSIPSPNVAIVVISVPSRAIEASLPPLSRRNSTVTLVPAGAAVGKGQFGMSKMFGGQRESGHTIECQRYALSP
jgi:hypothetical protein